LKLRTHRLRRVAAAAALGVGALGGVIGFAAGTAGATVHAKITATSAPSVGASGTTIGAGSLTITIPAGTALAAKKVTLKAVASGGSTFVHWSKAPSVSHTSGTATAAVTATPKETTLTLTITKAKTTTDQIKLSTVKYNLKTAHGSIEVKPTGTTGTPIVVFTTTNVVNAKAPGAPVTAPKTDAIAAASTPSIGRATGQTAGSWTLSFTATAATTTKAESEGWAKTEAVTVFVASHVSKNCLGTDYVLFTGPPTASVSDTGTSALPTVSVSTTAVTAGATIPCGGVSHNDVKLTFTNAGTFTKKGGDFKIALSGVKYYVGSKTTAGTVAVTAEFTTVKFATATKTATPKASNASIATVYLKANTPAVTVAAGGFDAAISPVSIIETAASTVKSGGICLSLKQTAAPTKNTFNPTSSAAKVTVTTGTGSVTSKVTYEKATGAAATTTSSAAFARFTLKHTSTTHATTYKVSGLKVNASTAPGGVTVKVTHVAATTNCKTGPTKVATATTAYAVSEVTKVIYGATADATAAKQLEARFKATKTGATTLTSCPGAATNKNKTNTRPVILATTKTFQDALSSSYLAGFLNTGTLLTPTTSLASVTKAALKTEGITQVYVVGGPLAVTTAVINTVSAMPAYNCGGTAPLKTTVHIHVTRIWGTTAEATAQLIAETPPADHVASLTFAGAYAGANATKGLGMYNDTAGMASATPLTAAKVPTAILASGNEFQDAMAASALAYGTSVPVLLTTPIHLSSQATNAIATLGIKQVILMGGPLAVTNTVVTSLTGMGVSVLRVAGKNYTDTSTELAKFEENTVNTSGRGWNGKAVAAATRTTPGATKATGKLHAVWAARGNGFTDGLAGAVITGHTRTPLVLTLNPTTVGTYLTAWLKASGLTGKGVNTTATSKLTTINVFGGPLAVTPAVITQMEDDVA
jgi:putative cell wall-binding protein